jgi:hypothetical protein
LITNGGTTKLTIQKIEISIGNSNSAPQWWPVEMEIPAGSSAWWTQNFDYVFNIPAGPLGVLVKFWDNPMTDPKMVLVSLVVHQNPTPQHNYLFWGAIRDLRPGEFWEVHGTRHGQTLAQMFGYDVGVSVESDKGNYGYFPGTDHNLTRNEDSRIWGKPVYAIADGKVSHFRNNYPNNPRPIRNGENWDDGKWYKAMFPDIYAQQVALKDGNGNFFTIETGDETVLYAHLQNGSLNPDFLRRGALVKAGDFLGLCGNSGFSSGPHMHIHACKTPPGATSTTRTWEGMARPMVWRGARVIEWNALGSNPVAAHWAGLNNRGFPPTDCAVWPSDSPVVRLRFVTAYHMAISEKGQLWVSRTDDHEIRTTNDLVSPVKGIYMNVVPGGHAKEVALVKEKPYYVGLDGVLHEGRPDGWVVVAGSPVLKRLSVNQSNGDIWCLTPSNGITRYSAPNNSWTPDPTGFKAKDICAWEGGVFAIGLDDFIFKKGTNGWTLLPGDGKAKRIAIDADSGQLWVIGMNDGIWSYVGSAGWNEHPWEGRGKDIVVHKGKPYVIGMDFNVWQSVGAAGWSQINVVEAY